LHHLWHGALILIIVIFFSFCAFAPNLIQLQCIQSYLQLWCLLLFHEALAHFF
jgi:hypothetical protein